VEKAGRWNQRRADEINEIPGETFWRTGQKLSIQNRSGNQHNAKHHRGKMKTDDSRDAFGGYRVIGHVVRRQPIFIAPNVTQQHQHEPGEIENEFFNRNRSAHGGYFPTESRRFVWENEESVAKEQVEEETERR
jgi:hypothetical protein